MGHILAARLGGRGRKNWQNLTPLFKSANSPVMSDCERFIAKLVKECKQCGTLEISVIGYGRNNRVPQKAKPAFPTRIQMTWTSEDGCKNYTFDIKNVPDAPKVFRCDLSKLPCKR